jgi:hypothetical protein
MEPEEKPYKVDVPSGRVTKEAFKKAHILFSVACWF